MEISTVDMKRCTLVRLNGRLDGSTAPELGTKLRQLMDSGRYKIVINMANVTYISVAGVRILIGALMECQRLDCGELCLTEVTEHVNKVLEYYVNKLFTIYATETEAVGSF